MWLLLQGWLLRNVPALLGWLAAAAAVAAVLLGARQAGRNAERIANMRRTVGRCSVTNSRLRAVVLATAASLLAGCATARSDGSPCPPVVAYNQDFLARAAGELDSLTAGSAIEQMLADYRCFINGGLATPPRSDPARASCGWLPRAVSQQMACWKNVGSTICRASNRCVTLLRSGRFLQECPPDSPRSYGSVEGWVRGFMASGKL